MANRDPDATREADIRARAASWLPEATFGLHRDVRFLLELIDRERAAHDARVSDAGAPADD